MVDMNEINFDDQHRDGVLEMFIYMLAPTDVRDRLRILKMYLDDVDKFIASKKQVAIRKLTSNELMETYPWWEDFEYTLRSSFLISMVSVLENRLSLVCDAVAAVSRSSLKAGDLRGSVIERSNLYIKSYGGFEMPTEATWQQVVSIYEIRNVLIHNHGFVIGSRSERRLRQFVSQNPGTIIDDNGILQLDDKLCDLAYNSIEEFLVEVINGCYEWCLHRKEIEFGK